ncbi:MAG: SH3 domain-containing protein [Chloroflexi bacterium]|nr:SH3 domain-containing protein [Ardenticatenaceae bacterium]NOG36798.1 SH3 domain-containing protein [Chloroflexota bacterium]
MSRRLALLIGNVYYQDGRLHTPVSGKLFTALADALESPAAGFDEVFVSVNKPAVELQLAMAEFLEMSQAPDDVLLLYFAGHALYHQARPYLACADTFTAAYLDATTIQADYVRRRFSLHPSRHKLVLLDCSTSPLLAGDKLPQDGGWLGQAFQAGGMQVVAAARPYTPDAPPHSTLTPALAEAIRTNQIRLDAAGLAAAAAWLSQMAAPPAAEVETPVDEVETVTTEAEAGIPVIVAAIPAVVTETEAAAVTGSEADAGPAADAQATADAGAAVVAETTALDEELLVAAAVETPAATTDSSPIEPESEAMEPAVMVRVDEATAVPLPRQFPKRAAVAALVILLLLVVAGGLYRRGVFSPTAVAPAPTPTMAAVAVLPTDEPTPSPTSTTAPPAATATATTVLATGQNVEATNTAVPAAQSPSPTSSPTPVVTQSPTPVAVQIVRQLVFMRSGPAINFRIVEYLAQGTAVTVLGRTESGEWYNVQLADGRTGWINSQMVAAMAAGEALEIPLVGTIPAPADEFYNFVAQRTDDGLTITVGHVYAGTAGPEGTFLARLLPETDLIQPTYENGQALGLGNFVVHFAKADEGEYTSTAVQLCMVSTVGVEFFCQTFPVSREW